MRGMRGCTVGTEDLELDRLHGDYKVWRILTDLGFVPWGLYCRACRFLKRRIRKRERMVNDMDYSTRQNIEGILVEAFRQWLYELTHGELCRLAEVSDVRDLGLPMELGQFIDKSTWDRTIAGGTGNAPIPLHDGRR